MSANTACGHGRHPRGQTPVPSSLA